MARGVIYLAAVLDWFTRPVLSWRVSITPPLGDCLQSPAGQREADFCIEAVEDTQWNLDSHSPAEYASNAGRFYGRCGHLEARRVVLNFQRRERGTFNMDFFTSTTSVRNRPFAYEAFVSAKLSSDIAGGLAFFPNAPGGLPSQIFLPEADF